MARPHFLTVAGAAQAFHLFPVSPDGFNSFGHVGTADRAKYSSAITAALPQRRLILGFTLSQDAYCLTTQEFSKKLPCMDGDVSSLERKLDQFLAHFHELREANRTLRERVDGLEGEKRTLTDKIEAARVRLEALMDRLPES